VKVTSALAWEGAARLIATPAATVISCKKLIRLPDGYDFRVLMGRRRARSEPVQK
jgi:hypothetical protein